MSAEGGGAVNLTRDPAGDYFASWSPDGQRIAFLSDRTGKPELFAMDADGSNLLQLTDDPDGEGWWPGTWSPDGSRRIDVRLVSQNERSGRTELQVVDVDGTGWRPLYPDQNQAHSDFEPQWMAGERVDFRSFRYTSNSLYSLHLGDPIPESLFVQASEPVETFATSPDGAMVAILVNSQQYGGGQFVTDLMLKLLDRESSRELAVPGLPRLDPRSEFSLAWSPESDRIAFPATENRGHRELWVWFVEFPGDLEQNLVAVTDLGGVRGHPTWSSDGEWVAFAAEVNGDEEIYVVHVGLAPMTAGATTFLRLTSSEGRDYDPAWRP